MDALNNPKTFIRLLIMFHRNIRLTEKTLQDKRLTQSERIILKAWFLLRKNKPREVIEICSKLSTPKESMVESQKNLLAGIAYNNLGQLKDAQGLLDNACKYLENTSYQSLKFIAYYNLFICFYNYGDLIQLEKLLKKINSLSPEHSRHKLLKEQCELMYFISSNQIEKAEQAMLVLDRQIDKMSESMKQGHFFDKIEFYISQERHEQAFQALTQFKQMRSFNLTDNYIYLKTMLEILLFEKPFYLYPQQFKQNPSLYYQLKVIHSLQSMDFKTAQYFWSKLVEKDPANFFEEYKIKENRSLFGLVLKKYSHHLSCHQPKLTHQNLETRKEKLLADLLLNSQVPISKDIIHQLIWGRPIKDKQDIIKLKKVVSRARQLFLLDIKYKNNCYVLIKKDSQVA